MDNKLVSINITTYNRANLLRRCIGSILRQTYENIEIVIADDCSTDGTESLVKKYQLKDSRIKYLRHDTNKGNAFSRNTALEMCSGYYVAFMDDDDEWIDENKLKKQVEIFEQFPDKKIGIVCTNPRIYHDENRYVDKVINKPDNLISRILVGNSIIYNSTCLTKKDIMLEVGGFDTSLPKGIDSDFFRNMIVNYGYDVFFMQDFTTAVYEYGDDRMTPALSSSSILRDIQSKEMCLDKYYDVFEKYTMAKSIRKKSIIKQYLKLMVKDYNLKYIKNILIILFRK